MIELIQIVLIGSVFLYGFLLFLIAFANWVLGSGFRLHTGDYQFALAVILVASCGFYLFAGLGWMS